MKSTVLLLMIILFVNFWFMIWYHFRKLRKELKDYISSSDVYVVDSIYSYIKNIPSIDMVLKSRVEEFLQKKLADENSEVKNIPPKKKTKAANRKPRDEEYRRKIGEGVRKARLEKEKKVLEALAADKAAELIQQPINTALIS